MRKTIQRMRNTGNNPNQKLWQDQKHIEYLPYLSVLRKLDELVTAGFTSSQIEKMLELGEQAYKK